MNVLLIGKFRNSYPQLLFKLESNPEDEVYLTKDLYSAWALISEISPDFIIVNYDTEPKKNNGLIKDMKTIHPNATIAVIIGQSNAGENEVLKKNGVEIVIDETMETEPLIEFYAKVKRSKLVLESLRSKLKVLN